MLEFLDETSRGMVHTVRWKLHNPNFGSLWLIHLCDGQTDGRTGDSALSNCRELNTEFFSRIIGNILETQVKDIALNACY